MRNDKNDEIKMITKTSRNKKLIYTSRILWLISTLAGFGFIYYLSLLTGIEDFIRYIIMGLVVVFAFLFLKLLKRMNKKDKRFKHILYIILMLIFIGGYSFVSYNIFRIYHSISGMNKSEITYTTLLLAMKESAIEEIKDINDAKIGIISAKDSIDGYIIGQEIIKDEKLKDNNEIIEYDDYVSMINDLYSGKIELVFISSNYSIMFNSIEAFANIEEETKIIAQKSKKVAKKQSKSIIANKNLEKPFTMLIMGVDSEKEDIRINSSFNGDALMIITFNPTTLNATILSIPRDTYVPIACFAGKKSSKITHAAWHGEDCMIDTIQNFTGINIDYFVKINFKGVVSLVDSLGGVDVTVPIKFCEQDSNRFWGGNTVCLDKGLQTLNGEQALALARHRKTINDFIRGQNQQLVVQGMLNKMKHISSINQLYHILDSISNNMDTNLSTSEILSFYNVIKSMVSNSNTEGSDLITLERLFLSGYDANMLDEGAGMVLYQFLYSKKSLDKVVDAMKINLGLKEPTLAKSFSFSINDPYQEEIIGQGSFGDKPNTVAIPTFVGNTKFYAQEWGALHDVTIKFVVIDKNSSEFKDTYYDGQIIFQSIDAGKLVSSINKLTGITIKIVSKPIITKVDCDDIKNIDNNACIMPDLKGKTESAVGIFENSMKIKGSITRVIISTTDEALDGLVKSQSWLKGEAFAGRNLSELTIEIYKYEEEIDETVMPGL